MKFLMIFGLIALAAWLLRKTDLSASERVRGMEDEELADFAAYDMACGLEQSAHYDEIARRAALTRRLAQ